MKIVRDIIYLFCLLYILFVPVELFLFSFQEKLTDFIFTDLISFTAHSVFGQTLVQTKISSDSVVMYVLVFLLFVFAIIIAVIANSFSWYKQRNGLVLYLCRMLLVYYLSLQLFIYGADKIFKAQFYLPEPNILYTPLGFVSRDLLYWSTIGSSHSYSVFLGIIEVIAALLLIFRKTRVLGLLMAAVLVLNIVAVNLSFDISVKIHSCFLLLLILVLLWRYAKTLFHFFISKVPAQITEVKIPLNISTGLKAGLKTFAICILLFEAFYPFIKTNKFNDDLSARPYLHGAYEVMRDSAGGPPIKRFFVHRDGYLIFQNDKDEMRDYKSFVDTISRQFILIDYNRRSTKMKYAYFAGDSILTLQYPYDNKIFSLKGKALKWQELPAIKKQFHWTVESVN